MTSSTHRSRIPIILLAGLGLAVLGYFGWQQFFPKPIPARAATSAPSTTQPPPPAVTPEEAKPPLSPEGYKAQGFKSIFNGEDFWGWTETPYHWSVRNGVIAGENPSHIIGAEPTSLIWNAYNIATFELHLSFRHLSGFAGIHYRADRYNQNKDAAASPTTHRMSGYLCELSAENLGRLTLIQTNGNHVGLIDSSHQGPVKGTWNHLIITVTKTNLTHAINGVTVVTRPLVDLEFPRYGKIALTVGTPRDLKEPSGIEFKDLWFRNL